MTYRLGRDVTDQAKATENRNTIVLSLRLNAQEFDALSDLANSLDRRISEVARAAVRHYLDPHDNPMTAAGPSQVWFDDIPQ